MRILAIILMMIIGTSHGWAKPGVDLFWSQSGGATHLVGPQTFSAGITAGYGADVSGAIHGQFKPAVTMFTKLLSSSSFSHVETGNSVCSAEIAANHSLVYLFCPQTAKLFSTKKPAMPGFESNSFIFRPPIF